MKQNKLELSEIGYVHQVVVGSVNPNNPLSDESRQKQIDLLNQCLNEYPRGIIIAKDYTVGRFMVGQHEFTMEKVTYHVGFSRKPHWLQEHTSI